MATLSLKKVWCILGAALFLSCEQVFGKVHHPEFDPFMPSQTVSSDAGVAPGVRVMVKMNVSKDPFVAKAKSLSGETDEEPSFNAMKNAWHQAWVGSQGTENGGWFVAEQNVQLLPILTPVGTDSGADQAQSDLSSLLLKFSYSSTSRIYVLVPTSQEASDALIHMFKSDKFAGAVEFAEKDQKMTLH